MPKHILNEKYISTIRAGEIAGVTSVTIINWCCDLGIGKKIAGTWHVDRALLKKVLSGELKYEPKKSD